MIPEEANRKCSETILLLELPDLGSNSHTIYERLQRIRKIEAIVSCLLVTKEASEI